MQHWPHALRIVIPMIGYYPDCQSGSNRLAFEEALFLANKGHEVWIIAPSVSSNLPKYTFDNGLHVLRYPRPQLSPIDPRRIWAHQLKTRELLSRYIHARVDLVHGHSLLQYAGALSLFGSSAKTCYSVHSPVSLEILAGSRDFPLFRRVRLIITSFLTHRIEHYCLKHTNCITADSYFTKKSLGQLHNLVIQKKTEVIPGWVNLEKFKIVPDRQALKIHLNWPIDIPVFFTLRRLVPRMGLDRLLYAIKYIKLAGWDTYLVIGGDGPLRSQLEALTKELGLERNVCFVGIVPEETLPRMYAAADVFVLPTAELECFGLIVIEALACGRPVLATPVGAIPEILNKIEPLWLAKDGTAESIAQLIQQFLRKELPTHAPEYLRQIVSRIYSKDIVLSKLVETALNMIG